MALGVLSSRLLGLVREAAFAAFFGLGAHADVLAAVFRGPNLLQNLLGEATLSASFIPVYSRMLGEGREREAGRFAGAMLGLLLATVALLSLTGIALAEPIAALFAPGFLGDAAAVARGEATVDRFALAVRAIRFTFPMAGVLVLSSWALGVLNSHRRFFLSYFAPVMWNVAILGALGAVAASMAPEDGSWTSLAIAGRNRLLLGVCVGALVGGLLQFGVQLPAAARHLTGFRLSLSLRVTGVRQALRSFAPLLAARGALQLSFYLDQLLASLLVAGALSAIRWSTLLYSLPISLFAFSVAAAELPELSRRARFEETALVAKRATGALRQIAFLVVPTAVGYLVFGFLLVGAVFRRGEFSELDNWLVYLVLAAYTLGLPAAAWSRLLSNVFYSRGETGRPARISMARVGLAAGLGALLMVVLDRVEVSKLVEIPGAEPLRLGAAGLALAAALAAWIELWLLQRSLRGLIPEFRLPLAGAGGMAGRSLLAAAPAAAVAWLCAAWPRPLAAVAVVTVFAAAYLGLSRRSGRSELAAWLGRFGRRAK